MILNKLEMIDTFLLKKDLLWILLNSKIQFLIFFFFLLKQFSKAVCMYVTVYVCVMFVHVCGGSHVYGGTCACM